MSVSSEIGAALVARRWWCHEGEELLAAVRMGDLEFHVRGRDSNGSLKPETGGKRTSLAGKAGSAFVAVVGTAAFGGGDDAGARPKPLPPEDLVVFGDDPECTAVRWYQVERPPGGYVRQQVWALTPTRFGVLIPVDRPKPSAEPTSGWRQLGKGWGDVGRALVGAHPEDFGPNTPGEPLKNEKMGEWLAFGRADFADCRPGGEGNKRCVLTFPDGSGFALNAGTPRGAEEMAAAVRTFVEGGGRG